MEPSLSNSSSSVHWQAAFAGMLRDVREAGEHGRLIDVREVLCKMVCAGRPLVMLCPHADDGAITAACLLHDYAVQRGCRSSKSSSSPANDMVTPFGSTTKRKSPSANPSSAWSAKFWAGVGLLGP